MLNKENITGIILSGGKSSRMGKDKGSCDFMGKPLVEYAIDALIPYCGEILISTNKPAAYKKYNYPLIADEHIEIGPIGGIYSSLKKSSNKHNIILSCDTPFINSQLVKYIIENIRSNIEIIVPVHENSYKEPLSAYYNVSVINKIETQIQIGNYKLMNLLKNCLINELTIDDSLGFYNVKLFNNLNSSEDLLKCM